MALVPVIDLAPAASATGRARVAREVGHACEQVGFFAITGHGVPQAVVDGAWNTTRRFFDLPDAKKNAVVTPRSGYPYGYMPLAAESLAYSLGDKRPPDIKESYSFGPADLTTPPAIREAAEFGWLPNIWPAEPSDFRDALIAYYRSMSDLAARLMRLFALALDLSENHFDSTIDRALSALRLLNYPDQAAPPEPGQLRAGAHTDYGSLTILLQEQKPGGLEVLGADGAWHEAPALPGAFMVNLGDLMARWTNDRWRSTLHRVVNPPRDAGESARRQSMAFFHQPNWDAEIVCIPSCLAPGDKPKYSPVLSGPHLVSKFRSTVVAGA